MRHCLTALNSVDSRTRRFKLSISEETLRGLVECAKTAGTPIPVVTELGEQIWMNGRYRLLFSLDSPKEEFCIFFSLFPNLNMCKFLTSADYWDPTPQMSRFPFAVVFGFIETFQSAGTKRVMELEVDWAENARREEETRNLLCDVSRHFGDQLKVVLEGTKKRGKRELWSPAHEKMMESMEYTVKLEIGFAVCVVMNLFLEP